MKRILITGGTGCIGSVTVYRLLQYREIEKIVVATRSGDVKPLQLWQGENIDPRIEFVTMDVSDYETVKKSVPEINPTHIIHLGGFQSPDCSAFHLKGMEINVGGTMALMDIAETLPNLERFVFASSGAVYGKRAQYPDAVIKEDVRLTPPNHYGIWKLAGEHLARFFHDNTHIPTVCLRLNTTYGPGRDKGMTSAPTAAMKAVALGSFEQKAIPFAMPYQGRENYHYVEDVGAHFAACTMEPFEGYGEFNIKGKTIEVKEFLQTVRQEAAKLGWEKYADISIAGDAKPNMFSHDLCHDRIDATFDSLPLTGIDEGVKQSLLFFRRMAEEGTLKHI
ncbi:MAG: NAD(P)-dependent oxidoreductase [Prevotellaceae bacterium]|jgi:nucleoside-diphosphate-sugar epimerase|nr:NAD(P)-dependent oxidoreductase [Prevotellaceae bacterium]